MKPKEIMLKDILKHIPKGSTPYLDLWYYDNLELCVQVRRKNEPNNGMIISKKDACVLARAELYKVEMLLRACNKCIANGGKP